MGRIVVACYKPDFVPIAQVGEASQPFAEFTPFTAGA